ncbi:MAG: cytochrome ubiquinol oxidase subunit I [Xanthobacteraceae bacterium]|nr:cytochrome ubiquinol oxidase subunit I [Xanthobacteraceae bacterium]
MELDPVLLARIQFAFTISFHIIFPSFTIGLAAYLATLEVLWGWTGAERYKRLAAFWTKIFAVSFAMGVVSGLVLSYQIGTNWSRLSTVAGNVIGPLMGYEVLMAFFLEATFLSIMLFGGERVPRWLHVFSAVAVAFGTALSAFWILSANSWMQTPAGYAMEGGIAFPRDWWVIVFNPSFPYRLAHMLNAAFLTGGFVALAIGARYLLADRHVEESLTMLRMAISLTAVLAPLQLFIGDIHAENTLKYQPTKIAAMEAHWDGSKPADFEIFAWPDAKTESNLFSISIPHVASLLVTREWDGLFPGLKDVPPRDRPPLPNVFFGFRIMVGLGLYMIAAALFGAWLLWRGRLFETRWYLTVVANTWWVGFVAVISGWVVSESGRQPWLIHGVLRTADAVSPVPAGSVLTTLVLFVFVYLFVFSFGAYFINRLINRGIEEAALPTKTPQLASGHP